MWVYGFSSALDTLLPQVNENKTDILDCLLIFFSELFQYYGGEDKKKMGIILQKALCISLLTSLFSSSVFLNSKFFLQYFISEPHIIR